MFSESRAKSGHSMEIIKLLSTCRVRICSLDISFVKITLGRCKYFQTALVFLAVSRSLGYSTDTFHVSSWSFLSSNSIWTSNGALNRMWRCEGKILQLTLQLLECKWIFDISFTYLQNILPYCKYLKAAGWAPLVYNHIKFNTMSDWQHNIQNNPQPPRISRMNCMPATRAIKFEVRRFWGPTNPDQELWSAMHAKTRDITCGTRLREAQPAVTNNLFVLEDKTFHMDSSNCSWSF